MNEQTEVYAFEVWVDGSWWPPHTINHRTAGKAKAEYFRDLIESYPDMPYTRLRARKVGRPITSEEFRRIAEYRALPDLCCGERILFGAGRGEKVSGVIVKAGSGANFGVLCDSDSKWPDQVVYVHPSDVIRGEERE